MYRFLFFFFINFLVLFFFGSFLIPILSPGMEFMVYLLPGTVKTAYSSQSVQHVLRMDNRCRLFLQGLHPPHVSQREQPKSPFRVTVIPASPLPSCLRPWPPHVWTESIPCAGYPPWRGAEMLFFFLSKKWAEKKTTDLIVAWRGKWVDDLIACYHP